MESILKDSCYKLNLNIDEFQINQFMLYKQILLEWNKKINLTAITDEKEIIIKHFVDCLSILSVYNIDSNLKVIDIGTGAGFPGVPLKILCPNISLTLIDSLNKRISFLNELVGQLNLQNVTCIHSRAEDIAKNELYREVYNLAVSRAVANLAVLAEYCLPFVKVGGHFISLKGPDIEAELNQSKLAIKTLGGEIEELKKLNLPYSDIFHSLIIIKKVRQTSKQYPRKSGIISKNPIK